MKKQIEHVITCHDYIDSYQLSYYTLSPPTQYSKKGSTIENVLHKFRPKHKLHKVLTFYEALAVLNENPIDEKEFHKSSFYEQKVSLLKLQKIRNEAENVFRDSVEFITNTQENTLFCISIRPEHLLQSIYIPTGRNKVEFNIYTNFYEQLVYSFFKPEPGDLVIRATMVPDRKNLSENLKKSIYNRAHYEHLIQKTIRKTATGWKYYSVPIDINLFMHDEKAELTKLEKERCEEIFKNYKAIVHSRKMLAIFDEIEKFADSDLRILLRGESGTGKEVIAHSIHDASHRKDGPFIVVNAPTVQENIAESDLFGHEKGAFTDAKYKKIGKLELANKGTLFIDEIGDLPLTIQAKLLRALEGHEIERLGGTETIKTDFRLISATNKPLERMVKDGRFRHDLFSRIKQAPLIYLPPLRERNVEIPFLAKHFFENAILDHPKYKNSWLHNEFKGSRPKVKASSFDYLKNNDYIESNVRDLEHDMKVQAALFIKRKGYDKRLNHLLWEDAQLSVQIIKEMAIVDDISTEDIEILRRFFNNDCVIDTLVLTGLTPSKRKKRLIDNPDNKTKNKIIDSILVQLFYIYQSDYDVIIHIESKGLFLGKKQRLTFSKYWKNLLKKYRSYIEKNKPLRDKLYPPSDDLIVKFLEASAE